MCNPSFNTSNNRINSTGYSFDSAGNTTADPIGQVFTYDGENKQVLVTNSSGTVGQYWYDGDGKRVKKYVPGTGETTIFVYDAADKEIAEHSTIVANSTDAKVDFLTADHLGSPRINTDTNGAVIARHDYMPFGEEIGSIGGRDNSTDIVRKQFTGYERDSETGLDYAQARFSSYGLGRFTTPDPFMGSSLTTNPQSWNRYSYVMNRPLTFTDPSGLKWGEKTIGDTTYYCWLPGKALCSGYSEYIGDGILIGASVNGQYVGDIRLLPNGHVERVVSIDFPGVGKSWIAQDDLVAINAISGGALCSLTAHILCPGTMDKDISDKVTNTGDAIQIALVVASLAKAGFTLYQIAMVLKGESGDITAIIAKLTLPELKAIIKEQHAELNSIFGVAGEHPPGPEAAQQVLDGIIEGKIPDGAKEVTKRTLLAYRKIAMNAIEGTKGDPQGTQIIRVKIIDELLKRGFGK